MNLTPVDEIKSRLDIADVVQNYVKLQRAGANFKASCPFHAEKTPSFFVSPERQSWHCFGCNLGGDMFSFVERIEGVEFKDALRLLAQRAGVTLTPPTREAQKVSEQKTRLAEANELACQFFETQLARSRPGNAATVYLKSRGVTVETLVTFRVGFAPHIMDGLAQFLASRGFSESELISSGLAIKPTTHYALQTTNLRDRFRGRIMFPILDRAGRVLGFSGRIFGRDEGEYDPKYLNTPQTILFEKSRVLFGLAQAAPEIRKKNAAVLVEGQMDCILSYQVGVTHVVASSGTALTSYQLRLLKRLTDTVIMAFDADSAGGQAPRRGVDLALEEGFMVQAAGIDAGKDPADFIRQDPASWRKRVEEPMAVIAFFLERALARHDPTTPEGKRQVSAELLPLVAHIANAIERSHWVGEIAQKLRVREETVWEELSRLPKRHAGTSLRSEPERDRAPQEPQREPLSRKQRLEMQLLATLLLLPDIPDDFSDFQFSNEPFGEFARAFQADRNQIPQPIRLACEPIMFLAEELKTGDINIAQEYAVCLRELNALAIRERLEALVGELGAAEQSGDAALTEALAAQVREHSQKLGGLLGNVKAVGP